MTLKGLKKRYPKNVSAMVLAERRFKKSLKKARANGKHLHRNKTIY
jgi:hypothetical protein